MGTDPLDIDNLIGEIAAETPAWAGIDPGAEIGHVHLTVNDLKEAEAFYTKVIGLEETQRLPSGAIFFSSDGYHHRVAVNNWLGENAPPPAEGAGGMRYYELVLKNQAAWRRSNRARRLPGWRWKAGRTGCCCGIRPGMECS